VGLEDKGGDDDDDDGDDDDADDRRDLDLAEHRRFIADAPPDECRLKSFELVREWPRTRAKKDI
jgi:hypothetical protein